MKSLIFVLLITFGFNVNAQWEYLTNLNGLGHHIHMFDSLHGLAATNQGLMETKDAWKTYKNLLPGFLVRGMDISKGGRIACSGVDYGFPEMGYRVSHDGGRTWLSTNHQTMEGHSRILFKGEDTIYAHGSRTKTNVSYDGGKSWQVYKVHQDITTWADLFLMKSGELFLSTANYKDEPRKWRIYLGNTTDTMWNEINSFSTETGPIDFQQVENQIYAVGGRGTFYKVSSDGKKWETSKTSFEHFPGNLFFLDNDTGFIGCGNTYFLPHYGVVMRTYDGGQTWEHTAVEKATRAIMDVHFLDSKQGFAIDYDGNVFKTTNAGGPATPDTILKKPSDPIDTSKVDDTTNTLVFKGGVDPTHNINLYPNPSKGTLNITWNYDTPDDAALFLVDVHGRILHQGKMLQSKKVTLELQGLSTGLYFVSLATPEGREVLRWVKE